MYFFSLGGSYPCCVGLVRASALGNWLGGVDLGYSAVFNWLTGRGGRCVSGYHSESWEHSLRWLHPCMWLPLGGEGGGGGLMGGGVRPCKLFRHDKWFGVDLDWGWDLCGCVWITFSEEVS